ncbi:MAG TPA: hypothetical protein VN887_19510 [Candidatus Angelobacter sp.]|nr:hypothetical protein [Candidatus Angelobacter sp.]
MTPGELRIHRQRRKDLSASYQQALNEISAILFRHDPIGINFEDNTDEYDPEAGSVLSRMSDNLSLEQTTTIVHEEFVRWFGRETADPRERYAAVAPQILAAYQKFAESIR